MDEVNNISALFKKPALNLNKSSAPMPQPTKPTAAPARSFRFADGAAKPATKPTETPKKDFSLVDFSKNKVIKDNSIYDKTFRRKTQQALKGTLKRFADRQDVADLLWDKRGYGGLTKGETRAGLNNLATKRGWSNDKTRAIKRKLGIY